MYALLFAHAGLSGATISGLFALWSATGVVCEVPAGALADRFSRRGVVVAGSLVQAVAFAVWTAFPVLPAFAAGFVLWGVSGALISGAFEALLYDELAALGAADRFGDLYGRVTAISLVATVPAAGAATGLYALGGFPLVGWVSVAVCLATAGLAARLPAARPVADDEPDGAGYLATLRSGLREAVRNPGVRAAVVAVATLGGLDAIEEYFPLMARDWGVPTAVNPVAVLAVPLAGAAGAAIAGRGGGRARVAALAAPMLGSATLLGVAALLHRPAGLAVVAASYALYRGILVAVETRLQERISGSRATVTSVAALGVEFMTFPVYAAWSLGGVAGSGALFGLVAVALPVLLVASGRPEPPPAQLPGPELPADRPGG